MAKVDFKKALRHLYVPAGKAISVVDVPPMSFLMVDGSGNPNTSPAYAESVEALYAVAYALKFKVKKSEGGIDYSVMPLEGLWWADDPGEFIARNKDAWQWTMMIMQPDFVTLALVDEARSDAERKKLAALGRMRFEPFCEGPSAQILYVGSYDGEASTIAGIHAFIQKNGWVKRGKHHEIYLSDPRKTAPERLKTVLRQPFAK